MTNKPLQGISILLVDDETDLLVMTKARLELDGAEVQEAQNGEEALQFFDSNSYKVIITDIRMPKMDGCQFVKAVREKDQETPIICMSGFSDYTDEEIIKWGANENFRKPLPIDNLIGKILQLTA